MADAGELAPGTTVAGHRLERLIGRGGMGEVYAARDLTLGRRVALKLLGAGQADNPTAVERFRREMAIAARIEHVGIVPVYAAGLDGPTGRLFISMRLVDGPDLRAELAAAGPLAPARAIARLGQLGAALQAVHAAGLVHRDVKPHNVLLWARGEPDEHALLAEFGIARAAEDAALTREGVIGTAAYMAPELWRGEPAGPASDQYALACVAYEMLTGTGPYGDGRGDVRERHLRARPRPLPSGIAPAIGDALAGALAKQPDERHPSVRAFVEALGGAAVFDRSEAVTRVLRDTTQPLETAELLTEAFGLTEETASLLTEVEPIDVIRRRRLAARRAVMGDASPPDR